MKTAMLGRQFLSIVLIILLLTSCSSQNDNNRDYVKRLQNVLDTRVEYTHRELLAFPSVRELSNYSDRGADSNTISIREFLSLRQCKLHTVLAHRNSLLGKVANASQLLFNDLDILATGPACSALLDDAALAEKLERYLKDKERDIGKSLFKAILADTENRAFWSQRDAGENYPRELPQEALGSITNLRSFVDSVLQGRYDFQPDDYEQIEGDLGELRFGDGGTLLKYYSELNNTLQHGNALINQRIERPLCLNDSPTPSARHFQNVVSGIFIEVLQRKAVQLNQREAQILPSYRQLEALLLSHASPAYQDWAAARDHVISNGRIATKLHVGFIQKLFAQCGLTVGHAMR